MGKVLLATLNQAANLVSSLTDWKIKLKWSNFGKVAASLLAVTVYVLCSRRVQTKIGRSRNSCNYIRNEGADAATHGPCCGPSQALIIH